MSARLLLLLSLLCTPVYAREPTHLRIATIAPDGTSWARVARAFSRDVLQRTDGAVEVKWYFGAIAGEEPQAIERVRRGQLDGVAASTSCSALAPSLRVGSIVGLFHTRREWAHVLTRLRKSYDEEFAREGMVNLGVAGFGVDLLWTRTPIRTMAELRKARVWTWNVDGLKTDILTAMGIPVVALPVAAAERAYAEHRVDGFIAVPSAVLAFQWIPFKTYFHDLPISYVPGCLLMRRETFDTLPYESQKTIRDAAAALLSRFEEAGQYQDDQLIGGLFERQGMTRVHVDDSLRQEFFSVARRVRESRRWVAPELLTQVLGWLAAYRAANPKDDPFAGADRSAP